MENLVHRAPSVGSIIKKVLVVNPDLGAQELIDIIRKSTYAQSADAGEFASAEVIDESRAMDLARATLLRN